MLAAARVEPGDVVLVSGTLADHGMAVMLARGDLALVADIRSDTAPLVMLTEALLDAAPGTRWLRDATRGGVGTVVNELRTRDGSRRRPRRGRAARAAGGRGRVRDARHRPPPRRQRREAGGGRRPPPRPTTALAAMRAHPSGCDAARIGDVRADPPGIAVLATAFGGTRILDVLVGDPLPRIC